MARSISLCSLFLAIASLGLIAGCGGGDSAADAGSQFRPVDKGQDAGSGPVFAARSQTIGGDERPQAQGGQPEPGGPVEKPAPKSGAQLDMESMPQGPPDAVLGYIAMLEGHKPRGLTLEQKRADLIRVKRLITEAADLVLGDAKASEDERYQAAEYKVLAINEMARLSEPNADQELIAVCERLAKDRAAKVARYGRIMLFSITVAKLDGGQIKDIPPVFQELKSLVAGPDEQYMVYVIGKQAARVFFDLNDADTARATLRLLGERYKNDKKAEVAEDALRMLREEELLSMGFVDKFRAIAEAKQPDPQAADELVALATKFIGNHQTVMELGIASQVAEGLERTEHYQAAGKMLDVIDRQFASSQDESVGPAAKDMVERGRLRQQLLGKPLTLAGNTVEGQPFDAAALRGKVVLVDFWATWCTVCLEEIPNIQKNYELYKDKGFEVVAYNLDDRPGLVNQFLSVQPLPWPVVVSNDKERQGMNSPLAQQCGVKGLPLTLLLDQEGKVVAMHVQGQRLGQKLAELLGPAGEQPAVKVGARPVR